MQILFHWLIGVLQFPLTAQHDLFCQNIDIFDRIPDIPVLEILFTIGLKIIILLAADDLFTYDVTSFAVLSCQVIDLFSYEIDLKI